MPHVGIATCLNLPEPDVDQELLLARFAHAGLNAEMAAWDDESVDWSGFDAVVIRSTWDYPVRPTAFRNWVEHTDKLTQLLNAASIVVPNLDKRYLLKMHEEGIPIVPTEVISLDLTALNKINSDRIVIKPAIGAGSYLTAFFDRQDESAMKEHISEIDRLGTVALAQPFMESVPHGGERSLVWIDGEFTHKIVKQPRFTGQHESVSQAVPIESGEREIAEQIMATIPNSPLYARVDLIEDKSQFVLNELELIEPSLFLLQYPEAADRLVHGVQSRL